MNKNNKAGKANGNSKNSGSTKTASARPSAPVMALKTAANSQRTSTVEAKPLKAQPTRQAIAEAAYFLWLKRGGNETVNWLEAEASLRNGTKI